MNRPSRMMRISDTPVTELARNSDTEASFSGIEGAIGECFVHSPYIVDPDRIPVTRL